MRISSNRAEITLTENSSSTTESPDETISLQRFKTTLNEDGSHDLLHGLVVAVVDDANALLAGLVIPLALQQRDNTCL